MSECLDQGEIWKVLSNVVLEGIGNGLEAAKLDEHRASGLDRLQESDCLIASLDGKLILSLPTLKGSDFLLDKNILLIDFGLGLRVVSLGLTEGSFQSLKSLAVVVKRGLGLCNDALILLELGLISLDDSGKEASLGLPVFGVPFVFRDYMFTDAPECGLEFVHRIADGQVKLHETQYSFTKFALVDLE